MNFDLSNIMLRAGQITWKHKSIWGLLIIPMLVAFLPFIFFFILFSVVITATKGDISNTLFAGLAIIAILTFVLSTIVNYVVRAVFSSAATLGVVRASGRGEGSTKFMDLLKDGLPYFRRILGMMLVINLTVGLAFSLFFLLVFVLIVVTIGMASICVQPLMILLTPLSFLMVGAMEAAQLAIVADGMEVMDAIKHGLQVVRAHVWKYVMITLIVYFGGSILTSFIIMPLTLPVIIVPFLIGLGQDMSLQSLALISGLFFCIFFPLMMLVSSILGVFMKASLDLTYLQLTGSSEK